MTIVNIPVKYPFATFAAGGASRFEPQRSAQWSGVGEKMSKVSYMYLLSALCITGNITIYAVLLQDVPQFIALGRLVKRLVKR